jgi:DNA-binding transcriptional ArsR family regulator
VGEREVHLEDFEEVQQALDIDRMIHEPARLVILAVLSKVEWVDFNFLLMATGLTKGNLSKQSAKLQEANYIEIEKYFKGRVPATRYRITPQGKTALSDYWQRMSDLQQSMRDQD